MRVSGDFVLNKNVLLSRHPLSLRRRVAVPADDVAPAAATMTRIGAVVALTSVAHFGYSHFGLFSSVLIILPTGYARNFC